MKTNKDNCCENLLQTSVMRTDSATTPLIVLVDANYFPKSFLITLVGMCWMINNFLG